MSRRNQAAAFARRHKWKITAHGAAAGAIALCLWLFGFFAANPGLLQTLVNGPKPGQTITITVPKAAVSQASSTDLGDHAALRGESPAGMTPTELDKVQAQQDALAANDQLPIVTPLAAPEQRGCITRLVGNYSTRRGVRPRLFVLHYTVSPNRPGWSDVDAVVYEFEQAAFQASSNYVIDNEGHCAYIVRESDKAWTQAALNPVSISIEEINSGHEASYAGKAGLAKIALVVSDALSRWKIPLQLGAVADGVVARAGIVDHGMLGPAGGGHHDISPYSVQQVIDAVKAYRAAHVPKPKPRPKPLPPCSVKAVQYALNTRAHVMPRLTVDGIAGPKTRAALARAGGTSKLGLHCRWAAG